MTHVSCLVIGEGPEEMLEPFSEHLPVEPYRVYENAATPREHEDFDWLAGEHTLAADISWTEYAEVFNATDHLGPADRLYVDPDNGRPYMVRTDNPNAKWDSYKLGGSWRGFWPLRANLRFPDAAAMTRPGRANAARKADIDFDAMRAIAGANAAAVHARVRAALADQPSLQPYDHFRSVHPDQAAADAAYYQQPALLALHASGVGCCGDPYEVFCLDAADPQAAYVTHERDTVTVTHALLTEDGWTDAEGTALWYPTSADRQYLQTFTEALAAAPDDALFSLYDLHI